MNKDPKEVMISVYDAMGVVDELIHSVNLSDTKAFLEWGEKVQARMIEMGDPLNRDPFIRLQKLAHMHSHANQLANKAYTEYGFKDTRTEMAQCIMACIAASVGTGHNDYILGQKLLEEVTDNPVYPL